MRTVTVACAAMQIPFNGGMSRPRDEKGPDETRVSAFRPNSTSVNREMLASADTDAAVKPRASNCSGPGRNSELKIQMEVEMFGDRQGMTHAEWAVLEPGLGPAFTSSCGGCTFTELPVAGSFGRGLRLFAMNAAWACLLCVKTKR